MSATQNNLHRSFRIPLAHRVGLLVRCSSDVEHNNHIRRSVPTGALEGIVRLAQFVLLQLVQHVLQQGLVLRVDVVVPLDRLGESRNQAAQATSSEQVASALRGGRESTSHLATISTEGKC